MVCSKTNHGLACSIRVSGFVNTSIWVNFWRGGSKAIVWFGLGFYLLKNLWFFLTPNGLETFVKYLLNIQI